MPELTDDDLHDIADPWHAIAEVGGSMRALAAALAVELLAARAEIAALRNDLEAKSSDFDAACRHLGEARERIAELEAAQQAIWDKRLAGRIVIDRAAEVLSIDDREFPWIMAAEGPRITLDRPGEIVVWVPILTDGAEYIPAGGRVQVDRP